MLDTFIDELYWLLYEYAWMVDLKPFHAEPHHGVHVILWIFVIFFIVLSALQFTRKGWLNLLGFTLSLVLSLSLAVWATHTSPLEVGISKRVPYGERSAPYDPPGTERLI